MKNILNKKSILILLAIIWIIFSVGYIINDQWQDYKTEQIEKAYIAGGSNAINTIIQEAQKCQPVPLFSGDVKMNIIAIECLQQAEKQAEAEIAENNKKEQ